MQTPPARRPAHAVGDHGEQRRARLDDGAASHLVRKEVGDDTAWPLRQVRHRGDTLQVQCIGNVAGRYRTISNKQRGQHRSAQEQPTKRNEIDWHHRTGGRDPCQPGTRDDVPCGRDSRTICDAIHAA